MAATEREESVGSYREGGETCIGSYVAEATEGLLHQSKTYPSVEPPHPSLHPQPRFT